MNDHFDPAFNGLRLPPRGHPPDYCDLQAPLTPQQASRALVSPNPATPYFSIGKYERSLRGCDEVMKRNPLHFGTLAGYGLIYAQLNQPPRVLDYFKRVLKINPNIQSVAQNIEPLEEQGRAKRKKHI
jgi:tetratricopeptide (TPR) repeat protein